MALVLVGCADVTASRPEIWNARLVSREAMQNRGAADGGAEATLIEKHLGRWKVESRKTRTPFGAIEHGLID